MKLSFAVHCRQIIVSLHLGYDIILQRKWVIVHNGHAIQTSNIRHHSVIALYWVLPYPRTLFSKPQIQGEQRELGFLTITYFPGHASCRVFHQEKL